MYYPKQDVWVPCLEVVAQAVPRLQSRGEHPPLRAAHHTPAIKRARAARGFCSIYKSREGGKIDIPIRLKWGRQHKVDSIQFSIVDQLRLSLVFNVAYCLSELRV